MARIPFPTLEDMTAEQLTVYDEVVSGKRGKIVGPLRAVLHSPDLAGRWSRLGEFLRYSTCLPAKLNELAIIVTGRRWNSALEFQIHAQAGIAAGLAPDCVEAIRFASPPIFTEPAEAEVYEYARLLQQTGNVTDAAHAAIVQRWGVRGVVELTSVIGYYTMVPMMLNTQEAPLPDGVQKPFEETMAPAAFTSLPPASPTP